jgi:hypothetical protein
MAAVSSPEACEQKQGRPPVTPWLTGTLAHRLLVLKRKSLPVNDLQNTRQEEEDVPSLCQMARSAIALPKNLLQIGLRDGLRCARGVCECAQTKNISHECPLGPHSALSLVEYESRQNEK